MNINAHHSPASISALWELPYQGVASIDPVSQVPTLFETHL